jgi:hypothetical protein
MSKEWLKKLRIIVPGIIIFIFLIPFFVKELSFEKFLSGLSVMQGVVFFVIVLTLGGIYYLLNLRKFTFVKPIEKIDDNIKDKITALCEHYSVLKENCPLKKGKTLMHIFYKFVDNDESLTQKSKSVMLNGIVLSTTADIIVLASIFVCTYLIAFALTGRIYYAYVGAVLLVISVLNWLWFLPKATSKQISLSDDQLDFIKVHYTERVRQKLHELCPNSQKPDATNSPTDN